MVRQAVFNMLGTRIVDAAVLDPFAGTGAFAAEALSRCAAHVVANDMDPHAATIIRKNLHGLGNSTVYNMDFRTLLEKLGAKYDVIFLDPPYDTDFGTVAIEIIKRRGLLAPDGIIVLECEHEIPGALKTKSYGRTKVHLLRPD